MEAKLRVLKAEVTKQRLEADVCVAGPDRRRRQLQRPRHAGPGRTAAHAGVLALLTSVP